MSELPIGWIDSTLGKVCVRASKVNPNDEPNKEITYLDIGGIDNEHFKIAETKTYKGSDAPSRARQLVEEGDVLFSTVRTYLKKIAPVPAHLSGEVASTGFTVLRGGKALDPKYLFYYVIQDSFIKPLSKIQRGTSYPAVRDSDVFDQPIRIAPLAEQRRIVARIEELFSRLDAGVAALRQAKAQLQRYRQSVLAAAVTGQLTQTWREQHPDTEPASELLVRILEQRQNQWSGKGKYKEPAQLASGVFEDLPPSWSVASLETLTDANRPICYGILMPKANLTNGVLYVKVRDMKGDKINLDSLQRTAPEIAAKYERASLKVGDLLLSIRGTYGRLAVIPPELDGGNITQDSARLAVSSALDRDYVAWAIRSHTIQNHFKKVARGVAVKGVNIGDVKPTPIPIPPIAEQHQIVAEVEARTSAIGHLEAELDQQITRSNRLRQSTLAAAFAGTL